MKIKNDKLFIQITCFVVAIVLWLTIMIVTNQTLEDTYKSVPVTIRNLSALENSNLTIMNPDKENITVNVTATGLTDRLDKLSKGDFSAYIDVLGFGEGVRNIKVEVVGPSGVEIKSVYPSHIACNIEAVISRVMDVEVQFEGAQARNYFKAQALPNPSSVKITGPRSIVNSASIAVANINIDGASDTVVKTVPVRIYDDKDSEIFLSAPTGNVEVTVPVYPTKYVTLKPTILGTPEEGYEVVSATVRPERVRIAARQDILDTVRELSLEELDITGSYNNILLSRNILNTEGLILLDMETMPVLNVVVEKIIEKEFVFSYDDIQFINKRDDTDAILEDTEEEITVSVSGNSTLINSLKKSDLILTADLAESVMGINTVELKCVSEFTFKTVTISKDAVNVEIIETIETETPEPPEEE